MIPAMPHMSDFRSQITDLKGPVLAERIEDPESGTSCSDQFIYGDWRLCTLHHARADLPDLFLLTLVLRFQSDLLFTPFFVKRCAAEVIEDETA